jgi:hypothetical protein
MKLNRHCDQFTENIKTGFSTIAKPYFEFEVRIGTQTTGCCVECLTTNYIPNLRNRPPFAFCSQEP